MATLRYTNALLTAVAMLLALHLWTMWATPDHGGGVAMAPNANIAYASGLPNAGQQRKQMVDLLKKIAAQSDDLVDLFASGRARVRMEENHDGDRSKNR